MTRIASQAAFEAINASLQFDRVLWPHDVAQSRAHARMLAAREIISDEDRDQILAGLDAVQAELAKIHHAETAHAVDWERAFLRTLEGGCATPFGCYVTERRAFLGQASESGWRSLSVLLPGGAPDERFIQDALSLLAGGAGEGGEPLFQPLAAAR